jgi:hypothetical protein
MRFIPHAIALLALISPAAHAQLHAPVMDFHSGVGPALRARSTDLLAAPTTRESVMRRARTGYETTLNWALLDTLDPNQSHRVALPDPQGVIHEVVLFQTNTRAPDDYDWAGQIAGRPFSDVFLSRHKDGFHAVIRDYHAHKTWTIEGDSAGRFYVLDSAPLFDIQGPLCDPSTSSPARAAAPGAQGTHERSTANDPAYTVDLMTVATKQVLQQIGANNFVAVCRVATSDFNARAANSRVTGSSPGRVTLRLVAVDTESGQNYDEIPSGQSSGGTDPTFGGGTELSLLGNNQLAISNQIATVRALAQADLVMLCRWSPWQAAPGTGNSVGGIAFQPSNSNDLNSGDGYWSVCSMNHASLDFVGDIFAHEVGHNMALVHDFEQYLDDIDWDLIDGPPPPASQLSQRPHGYKDSCEAGCVIGDLNFHTTMAYGVSSTCGSSTLVPYFSSPQYSYDPGALCPSDPVGDPFFSWAAELTLIAAPTISQYRIGASQRWVAPGASGPGTLLDPLGSITAALSDVQGNADEARVRIKAGDYNLPNPTVLTGNATLSAEGGAVTIR